MFAHPKTRKNTATTFRQKITIEVRKENLVAGGVGETIISFTWINARVL